MKLSRLAFAAIVIGVTKLSVASSLTDYVAECKAELGFDTLPEFDCQNENFAPPQPGAQVNDWVAHRRVNDEVDAILACRWVKDDGAANGSVKSSAAVELIVHNRWTGGTCFFFEKSPSTTRPLSPTDANADLSWEGMTKTAELKCTQCHVAGPYIASPKIAKALQKYGLINDRHDINNTIYHAVGSRLGGPFNKLIADSVKPFEPGLATCYGCHVVGGKTTVGPIMKSTGVDALGHDHSEILIPSISSVINEVTREGHMPPNDPASDFRWVNRDSPSGTGDSETIDNVNDNYPELYCRDPNYIEAHETDSSSVFRADTNGMTAGGDTLHVFNLQDGLICKDEDQPSTDPNSPYQGCWNWQTRYKCKDEDNKDYWADWLDVGAEDGGEYETRARYKTAYEALHKTDTTRNKFCASPSAIQARFMQPNSIYSTAITGPRDRLYRFNNKGLVCRDADQDNGNCHNYVVRFNCP